MFLFVLNCNGCNERTKPHQCIFYMHSFYYCIHCKKLITSTHVFKNHFIKFWYYIKSKVIARVTLDKIPCEKAALQMALSDALSDTNGQQSEKATAS